MTRTYETARFHIDTGPTELFQRVQFAVGSAWPLVSLPSLQPALVAADVRVDTGHFVESFWTVNDGRRRWWIVVSRHGNGRSFGLDQQPDVRTGIVRAGELFERVARVNRELMSQELFADGDRFGPGGTA